MEEATATATAAAEKSVEVRFVTRLGPEWKVTETPFSVPARLTRFGLSEVVNHLLGRSSDASSSAAAAVVPFDFLAAGDFVRTSLGRHLRDRGVAAGEGAVSIEYTFADPPPAALPPREHGDWVGALCCCGADEECFVSGGYDGRIRAWWGADAAQQATAQQQQHRGAVKALAAVPGTPLLLSAGKDRVVRVWRVSSGGVAAVQQRLAGHGDSVDGVDASPDGSRACSASWDGTVRLWALAAAAAAAAEPPAAKKQRAAEAEEAVAEEAVAVLRGHTDAAVCVQWPTHVQLVSGGHDGTVRLWDAARAENVATMRGQKAVACVAYSTATGLCVSGHHDGHVRFWDPRAAASSSSSSAPLSTRALRAHKGWVTAVAWHPRRDTLFLSAATDGALKVWDLRSAVPMHVSRGAHGGSSAKILCACWWAHGSSLEALSGGTDGTVQRRLMPS